MKVKFLWRARARESALIIQKQRIIFSIYQLVFLQPLQFCVANHFRRKGADGKSNGIGQFPATEQQFTRLFSCEFEASRLQPETNRRRVYVERWTAERISIAKLLGHDDSSIAATQSSRTYCFVSFSRNTIGVR